MLQAEEFWQEALQSPAVAEKLADLKAAQKNAASYREIYLGVKSLMHSLPAPAPLPSAAPPQLSATEDATSGQALSASSPHSSGIFDFESVDNQREAKRWDVVCSIVVPM